MKKLVFKLALASVVFAMQSCAEEPKDKSGNKEKEADAPGGAKEACVYSLDENKGLEIRWIAYKHSAKVPVEGSFKVAEVNENVEPADLKTYLMSLQVKVPTSWLSTQDEARDVKIVKYFFEIFKSPEFIEGKITKVDGTDQMGTGTIAFTMNEISYSVPFDYVMRESGELVLSCTIDVNNWNGQSAIASLNAACEERHTGEDGQSVLWSEVKVVISGFLNKKC